MRITFKYYFNKLFLAIADYKTQTGDDTTWHD